MTDFKSNYIHNYVDQNYDYIISLYSKIINRHANIIYMKEKKKIYILQVNILSQIDRLIVCFLTNKLIMIEQLNVYHLLNQTSCLKSVDNGFLGQQNHNERWWSATALTTLLQMVFCKC